MQHDEARKAVGRYFWDPVVDAGWLCSEAERVRRKLSDSDFETQKNEVNADFITRFADVLGGVELPKGAEVEKPGRPTSLTVAGVRVNTQIAFRVTRRTKTNEVRVGAGALRYSKGRPLPVDVGEWQAAFLHGYLARAHEVPSEKAEPKLCVVVDAYVGVCISAPSNSVSRYLNMEAACATIAEQWPNIAPPKGAIF